MANDTSGAVATAQVIITVNQSKFARSLAKARGTFRKAIVGMNRLGSAGFRGMKSAMKGIGTAFGGLAGMAKRLFKPLAALSSVGIVGIFSGSAAVFAAFEQRMARVHAVTGATDKQFAALSKQARQLGATTAFSASQAAEAMGNFGVAGFKTKEIMNAMKPTLSLAAAGQLDMATSSDIVAKIMRGMGLDAEQTGHAVDVMAKAFTTSNTDLVMLGDAFKYVGPIGKAAGKSLEELTASIQVMSNAGIQGGQAGAALRNILLRLQTQPSEVKKALKSLGVEIGDSNGRMRSMADIIDDLNAAMADKTEMERNSIASAIASTRASAAFLELLSQGGDTLRKYQKNLEGAAGTADRIASMQLNTLKGSFVLLKSAMEGAAIAIGEKMAPGLRMVAEAMSAISPVVGRLLSNVKILAETMGTKIASSIYAMNTALKQSEGIAKNIFEYFSILISNPLGGLKIAGLKLGAVGLEWGAAIMESGGKLVSGIGRVLGEGWRTLSTVMTSAWTVLKAVMDWGAQKITVAIKEGLGLDASSARHEEASLRGKVFQKVMWAKYTSGQAVGSMLGGAADLAMGDPAGARREAANMRKLADQEWTRQAAARDRKNQKFKTDRAIASSVESGVKAANTTTGRRAGLAANIGVGLLTGGLLGGVISAATAASTDTGKGAIGAVAGYLGSGTDGAGAGAGPVPAKATAGGGSKSDVGSFLDAIQKGLLGETPQEKVAKKQLSETKKQTKPIVEQVTILGQIRDTLKGGLTPVFGN